MKQVTTLIAAALLSLPVAVHAQTAATPAAPAATTSSAGTAKPAKAPGTTLRSKVKRKLGKGPNSTPIGDNPSYPAPARDGTATK